MAHEVESLMFREEGGAPWHGLGTAVQGYQTAAQALAAAGLDWTVEMVPLYTQKGNQYLQVSEGASDHLAIRRATDARVFGCAGKNYTPLQNQDAFAFTDHLLQEAGAKYDTAGALMGGRIVFLLCRLPDEITIKNTEDALRPYFLLTNSHDGWHSVQLHLTRIRVVCFNTLNMAIGKKGSQASFRLRHTQGMHDRLTEARAALSMVRKDWEDFGALANALAKKKWTKEQLNSFLDEIYPPRPEEKRREGQDAYAPQTLDARDNVKTLVAVEAERFPKLAGTAWQALNAAIEVIDYSKPIEVKDWPVFQEARLRSMWFGQGKIKKQLALDAALKVSV